MHRHRLALVLRALVALLIPIGSFITYVSPAAAFDTAEINTSQRCDAATGEHVVTWTLTSHEDTGEGVKIYPVTLTEDSNPGTSGTFSPQIIAEFGGTATFVSRHASTYSGVVRLDVPLSTAQQDEPSLFGVERVLVLPCASGVVDVTCRLDNGDPHHEVVFTFTNRAPMTVSGLTATVAADGFDPVEATLSPDSLAVGDTTTGSASLPGSAYGPIVVTLHYQPGGFTTTFAATIDHACERPPTSSSTTTSVPTSTTSVPRSPTSPRATDPPTQLAATGRSTTAITTLGLIFVVSGWTLRRRSRN